MIPILLYYLHPHHDNRRLNQTSIHVVSHIIIKKKNLKKLVNYNTKFLFNSALKFLFPRIQGNIAHERNFQVLGYLNKQATGPPKIKSNQTGKRKVQAVPYRYRNPFFSRKNRYRNLHPKKHNEILIQIGKKLFFINKKYLKKKVINLSNKHTTY